jgi:organic hydroperoxide reductase OsmC/OhrA
MSEHHFAARLTWTGAEHGPVRDYDGYSREYRIDIDGKPPLVGSAAQPFRGDPRLHNPEDLLVAALSSCHCLSYLALCARAGIVVETYEDAASGRMAWDAAAKVMRFSEVMLRPTVRVVGGADVVERARALHEKAHHACFIAASVSFPVRNQPTVTARP